MTVKTLGQWILESAFSAQSYSCSTAVAGLKTILLLQDAPLLPQQIQTLYPIFL